MSIALFFLLFGNVISQVYSSCLLDVYAPVDTKKIFAHNFELDDVSYVRLTPKNNVQLSEIAASHLTIWKSEDGEACTSVLFAYNNGKPELAFLFLKRRGTKSVKYCNVVNGIWGYIGRKEYVSHLKALKASVKTIEVLTLDISKDQDRNKYTVARRTRKPSNIKFSPRIGYRVTSIVDNGKPVWKAEGEGDRSIFVWFYVYNGRRLMLRNLVTYANGYSEFRVYIYISNQWVYSKNLTSRADDVARYGGVSNKDNGITTPDDFIHPDDVSVESDNGITTPDDFIHPDDVSVESDDGITTPDDFIDPEDVSANKDNGITTPEDFEEPRPSPLPFDKFTTLDFDSGVDTSKCAVIKGKTNGADVTLYYSLGFYFDNIAKDGLVIWNSHSPFEGATSVSFYCKGKLQLADVLVVNPKNGDNFQYYVKNNKMWKPLGKQEFLSFLNGHSKVEDDSAFLPFTSGLVLMIACTLAFV